MGQSLFEQAQAKSHRLRQKLKELLDQWLDQWLTICFVSRECWMVSRPASIKGSYTHKIPSRQHAKLLPRSIWSPLAQLRPYNNSQNVKTGRIWLTAARIFCFCMTVNSLLRPSLLQAII
jgi:hypothetical protein